MHAVLVHDMVDVSIEEVMTKFMADAEPLEPFTRNVRGIHDAEGVAVAEQHTRHTFADRYAGSDLSNHASRRDNPL